MSNTADTKRAPHDSLYEAAASGDLEAVKTILDNGADINAVDSLGSSPLHAAAKEGHWDIARLLVEKGMSPWTRDGNKSLPIHDAARGNHIETGRLLLECDRATGSHSNKNGTTPLHFAVESGNIELVQLLLSFNIVTTASSYGGETALHLAAKNGQPEICEILMKYDDAHKPGLFLRMLGITVPVKMKDFCNHTPIVYAVEEGHVDVVDVFLRSKRVSPKARNRYKDLLFHEAVQAGKCHVVQVFLHHGVPVNLRGRDGKRALHLAADTRNLEMARLLLENGASTKIKDSIGNTPSERSRDAEVTMLIRNWADQAAALDPKGKKALPPPKAAVAAPPEYVA
ncbi:hypothetical protein N7449_002449 [Penicillium cf. viridicatum]|uniref:Uncharacterized protein n=1 Tax=Penicillium cf. viridicatum TaxID=2972119 RepID=A0A9W9T499_9EURO|nr:hypothetical protein N7449_002449 [Penicillium cf. viridicatum]